MSDRRPSKLWKRETGYVGTVRGFRDPDYAWVEASPADLVAVVRRGVESGTIKGEVVRWCKTHNAESIENHGVGLSDECWRVVWVPHDEPEDVGNGYALCRIVERLVVSDGGSET